LAPAPRGAFAFSGRTCHWYLLAYRRLLTADRRPPTANRRPPSLVFSAKKKSSGFLLLFSLKGTLN
jgi:hypothetical protein